MLKIKYSDIKDGTVNGFRGEYSFLSNMFEYPMEFLGVKFKCAEAAFQALKLTTVVGDTRFTISDFKNLSGPDAKRLGKSLPIDRYAWDAIKIRSMTNVIHAKFSNEYMAGKLLETKGLSLYEVNTWGDFYWGVVKDRDGFNVLGSIISIERMSQIIKHYLSRLGAIPIGRQVSAKEVIMNESKQTEVSDDKAARFMYFTGINIDADSQINMLKDYMENKTIDDYLDNWSKVLDESYSHNTEFGYLSIQINELKKAVKELGDKSYTEVLSEIFKEYMPIDYNDSEVKDIIK